MLKSVLLGSLHLLKWALCAVGVGALLLTALVATPLTRPPELRSISAARGTVDFSDLPSIERFQARDGTALGFRHYLFERQFSPPDRHQQRKVIAGESHDRVTILHQRSSGE